MLEDFLATALTTNVSPVSTEPAVRRNVTALRFERLGGPGQAAALALLAFAMLIVSLDQYIVVVALPHIARGLGFSAQTLQAVISAYAVASAGLLLFGGRTADLRQAGSGEEPTAADGGLAEFGGAFQCRYGHRDRTTPPRPQSRRFELERNVFMDAGEQSRAVPDTTIGIIRQHIRQRLVSAPTIA